MDYVHCSVTVSEAESSGSYMYRGMRTISVYLWSQKTADVRPASR